MQGPPGAGGVAQLFVAHPTGIALPVGSRGLPTPALMEGLNVAAGSPGGVPLVPASGAFAYEYLDTYGQGPAGGGGGEELEVTDRVASTAPGFFNAMFMQRAALPGYGGPPPPQQQQQQQQYMSPGASSGGGALPQQYYTQPYEYAVAAAPPPPPVAYYAQPPQVAAAYPQMAPRGYTPATTGGSGGGGSRGRAPRRSDPANTSPARRRVEFSGVRGSPGAGAYSPGGGSGGGSGSERGGTGPAGGGDGDLALQVRFLEDLVSRLSAEVSRRAVSPERATAAALALAGAAGEHPASPTAAPLPAAQPPAATAAPAAPAAPPAVDYEALLSADALGAAAVLRDQKLLAPLLGAYDGRIAALEADLRSRTDTVAALKATVDEVVEENDRLRADAAAAAEARDAALAQVRAGGRGWVGAGLGSRSWAPLESWSCARWIAAYWSRAGLCICCPHGVIARLAHGCTRPVRVYVCHAQASRNAEAMAQANSAAAAAAAAVAGASTHAEEAELLRRENELLITQQVGAWGGGAGRSVMSGGAAVLARGSGAPNGSLAPRSCPITRRLAASVSALSTQHSTLHHCLSRPHEDGAYCFRLALACELPSYTVPAPPGRAGRRDPAPAPAAAGARGGGDARQSGAGGAGGGGAAGQCQGGGESWRGGRRG